MAQEKEFLLEVPLDASQVSDFKPDRPVKVAVYSKQGQPQERSVTLNAEGKGSATFRFPKNPGSLQVALGPDKASAEDLQHLQTISVNVPSSSWRTAEKFTLSPVVISSYYWWWWWRWCQNYTVTGRVVCADGSPVVGATVSAIDVDYWWWWSTQQQVGSATTDATGSFQITFTRCCGWWPWWWWETREWLLDPILVDKITASVKQHVGPVRLPAATATPSLGVFQSLLTSATKSVRADLSPNLAQVNRASLGTDIDLSTLDSLRNRLSAVLPKEFPYPIWPWYPWDPWWNCNANLIFKVTQVCGGQTNTIVDETVSDTRWDIPTSLNVTLTASSNACCAYSCGDDDCPDGNCIVPTDVCGINVGSIGGNVGAGGTYPAPSCTAPQVGLYSPGSQDRPFAGSVDIYGTFGDEIISSNIVDYYEFQYSYLPFGGGTPPADGDFAPLPFVAVGGLTRQVLLTLPGPVYKWVPVSFPVNVISDGTTNHNVIETIAHYEANNGAQVWDAVTHDLLMALNSLNSGLTNGIYYLRLMGFSRPGYTGNLVPATTGSAPTLGVPPVCDPIASDLPVNNWWAVNIDNQAPGDTDPSGQPCGLHVCTDQPIADILQIAVVSGATTTVINGCDNVCINPGDQLQIDFAAYDPDGFLDSYSLELLYGFDQSVNLMCNAPYPTCDPAFTTWSLGPSPLAPSWAPGSTQVGPAYANALTQGATSPVWNGGSYRLTVNASSAFPTSCAYLLQLYVWKRPIQNCVTVGIDEQYNLSFETFTILTSCPEPCPPLAAKL
jgi:hypothetical protein